jgi:hypothetical protein
MKNNKINSNNDYFIEKWCGTHLRLGVLSKTFGLKRPPIFFPTLEVPIRYRVLNGKDPTNTNVDALTNLFISRNHNLVNKDFREHYLLKNK